MYEPNILQELLKGNNSILKGLKEKDIISFYPYLKDKLENFEGSSFREKLYLFLFKTKTACETCGLITKFDPVYFKYTTYCSKKCSNSNPELIKQKLSKQKKTLLKKYGTENINTLQSIKEKIKNTNIEKYGKDYAKDKFKKICLKFGIDNISQLPEVKEKIKNKCFEKYGVSCNFKAKEVKEKSKKSNIEKYGELPGFGSKKYKQWLKNTYNVDNIAQVTEIFDKRVESAKKFKKYILPSGAIVKVQGFENKVLDFIFLNNLFNEDDLIIENSSIENYIGKIYYNYNNKKKRYYPDLFIKSTKTIIEVKSTFTYKLNPEKDQQKLKVCKSLGYNFEIFIFDNNKIIIKNSFKDE